MQLQHWLAKACRLLAQQHANMTTCIELVEKDMKQGILDGLRQTLAHVEPATSTSAASDSTMAGRIAEAEILEPGRHVAAKVARSHELWILARILAYSAVTRTYEVEDVDSGDDDTPSTAAESASSDRSVTRRRHIVPVDQVKALPAETLEAHEWIHYELNQPVMALYPNTTSFYRGVVRVPNPRGAPYVLVRFDDDADEFGSLAPDRKIPFRFVIAV
ncbi:hypothetical protein PINS_up013485 [Pythium insidiosum]|nr:hypothetical protein PINS_up013485 [Pythium insidiosum]